MLQQKQGYCEYIAEYVKQIHIVYISWLDSFRKRVADNGVVFMGDQ